MTPGSVITTPYGPAVVIREGLIEERHKPNEPAVTRPGLYVRYPKATLTEAGRQRWPGGGPDVYDVIAAAQQQPTLWEAQP